MESRLDEPLGIEVQDLGDRLRITRRWFYWTSVPLGLFALAWIGLTLCRNADNLLNVCNFLFLGLGLLALYITVLSLTNSTEIEVDRWELTIQHGPLPSLGGNKTVPVRNIDQLFLKTIKISGNLSGTSRDWALCMVDRFGEERELIGAMPDWNQAQFIKQEIGCFLSRVRSEEEKGAAQPQGNAEQPMQGLRPDLDIDAEGLPTEW
jgi:hypothetical protein